MAVATTSLPVPVSPVMSTGTSLAETFTTIERTASMAPLCPRMALSGRIRASLASRLRRAQSSVKPCTMDRCRRLSMTPSITAAA